MVADTVVSIIPEDILSDVLTQVHRSGMGNNARVLRPRRAAIRDQLRRAGMPVEQAPVRIDTAPCILMVMAAARSKVAADLMQQHGASATWIVTRNGAWSLIDESVVVEPAHPEPTPETAPAMQPATLLKNDDSPDSAGPI